MAARPITTTSWRFVPPERSKVFGPKFNLIIQTKAWHPNSKGSEHTDLLYSGGEAGPQNPAGDRVDHQDDSRDTIRGEYSRVFDNIKYFVLCGGVWAYCLCSADVMNGETPTLYMVAAHNNMELPFLLSSLIKSSTENMMAFILNNKKEISEFPLFFLL